MSHPHDASSEAAAQSAAEASGRRRAFTQVLVNTFVANLTTSFLWFALTFWIYLETRNVLATAFLGGSYMLMLAVLGVPFGGLIDRWRKKRIMVGAQLVTAVAFAAALVLFLVLPKSAFIDVASPAFWALSLTVLAGAVVESARGIALSTTVTLLVPAGERDKANGRVGVVNGLSFAATSVFSGLAVGRLGMTWTLVIAVALTFVSLVHLWFVRIPEKEIVHADGAPKPVDFAAAWASVRAVPGLLALIVFSTFNNLVGGVFMALLDPYGLTLVPVEVWGLIWGLVSFGMMFGGIWVARFGLGAKPLRALLLVNVVMWGIGILFTLRENIWLTTIGILIWISIMPVAEAAEQTVMQRVVPYARQGRVFGFAQAVEVAASPLSAFLVGPLAQFWLIPYMASPEGRASWGWLLGDGQARGIAAVFVLSSVVGLAITLAALASRPYRVLSDAYASAPAQSVTNPGWPDPGAVDRAEAAGETG